MLVQISFDLHSHFTDSVRLVPVNLRQTYRTIREVHRRYAFELTPTSSTKALLQSCQLSNVTADGDDLCVIYLARYFEILIHGEARR